MDKRTFAKKAAEIVVMTSVGSFVTKALVANYPKTQKLHTADIVGGLAGYYASEQLRPVTDDLVDAWFDAREAKKQKTS